MASFGGYGGGDAGGFMSGSQQGSQGQGEQKSYQNETLRPVTVKQILDAEETYPGSTEFRIDGTAVSQVTFVAQIRQLNRQETNIQYKLDDGTATTDVKKYVDSQRVEAPSDPAIDVGGHVRVYGRLKSFNNKRFVSVHFIRAVEDYNEVGFHLLEAAAVHLYLTKGPLGKAGASGAGAAAGGDGMFVEGGAGAGYADAGAGVPKLGNVSAGAQRLFNHLLNVPGGNEGVHYQMLSTGSGMSVREVQAAADELFQQGVIYTTIDDETWAVV